MRQSFEIDKTEDPDMMASSFNALVSRRRFLASGGAGLAGLALLASTGLHAADDGYRGKGVLVLDNCDPWVRGKVAGDNNLTCFNFGARQVFRVSGLHVCEEIGSPHK